MTEPKKTTWATLRVPVIKRRENFTTVGIEDPAHIPNDWYDKYLVSEETVTEWPYKVGDLLLVWRGEDRGVVEIEEMFDDGDIFISKVLFGSVPCRIKWNVFNSGAKRVGLNLITKPAGRKYRVITPEEFEELKNEDNKGCDLIGEITSIANHEKDRENFYYYNTLMKAIKLLKERRES